MASENMYISISICFAICVLLIAFYQRITTDFITYIGALPFKEWPDTPCYIPKYDLSKITFSQIVKECPYVPALIEIPQLNLSVQHNERYALLDLSDENRPATLMRPKRTNPVILQMTFPCKEPVLETTISPNRLRAFTQCDSFSNKWYSLNRFNQYKLCTRTKSHVTDIHYDTTHNLVIQVQGKERWVLISPRYYNSCYCSRSMEKDRPFKFQASYGVHISDPWIFSSAKVKVIDVEAGQGLYLPGGYLRYIEALEDSSMIHCYQ